MLCSDTPLATPQHTLATLFSCMNTPSQAGGCSLWLHQIQSWLCVPFGCGSCICGQNFMCLIKKKKMLVSLPTHAQENRLQIRDKFRVLPKTEAPISPPSVPPSVSSSTRAETDLYPCVYLDAKALGRNGCSQVGREYAQMKCLIRN